MPGGGASEEFLLAGGVETKRGMWVVSWAVACHTHLPGLIGSCSDNVDEEAKETPSFVQHETLTLSPMVLET